jgi:hypothetical protein
MAKYALRKRDMCPREGKKKNKRQKGKKSAVVNRGRWELHEKKMFLKGYLTYGRGKWKEIATMIPKR